MPRRCLSEGRLNVIWDTSGLCWKGWWQGRGAGARSVAAAGDEERDRLLYEWNHTLVEYPRRMCVQEMFEDQVKRIPEAVAVEFDDVSVSYGELNRRANQLAHYLRDLGVKPAWAGGYLPGTQSGHSSGHAGGIESRRGLCAVDPTCSARKVAIHAAGQRFSGATDTESSAGAVQWNEGGAAADRRDRASGQVARWAGSESRLQRTLVLLLSTWLM